MMAGNPNWWSMHPPSLIPPQYVLGSSSIPFNSLTENPAEPTHSWSQLLFAELPGEERLGVSHFQPKRLEIWDDQIVHPSSRVTSTFDVIKQETSHSTGNLYGHGHGHGHEEFHASGPAGSWPNLHMVPVSSPSSCVTSLCSNNILDFAYNNKADHKKHQLPDHTSECNSTSAGGVCKKARVQPSSSQPPLKVRKEKLGDRITALHQLVSPFGKTDTASVLLEAIGYIRFLQGQIEALSSPYLGNASKNMRNQQPVHGAERSSVFPEDPGQLLNDNGLKRKEAPNQDAEDKPKDLRSIGLCLVPVSCTQHVGSETGAHYWAPAYGSGF
ncbi:hypothetical protein L6164_004372 [Bauhinia variegata]|uniref:Uncharacterized protein n=1 Tax=Bauhinia variegata TaxID=167791 RepID=A0ACB9Q3N2_BAUVA|nr:hypothetical protein L6164_004372 [Bauhinia variegata]